MLRSLLAVVCLAVVASAGRQTLPNIGLSAHVPEGWVVAATGDNSYAMYDTTVIDVGGVKTIRNGGQFLFDAYAGAAAVGLKAWDSQNAYAWRLYLANAPCYGWVFRHDSTSIDGHFAMFVQGELGTCDSASVGLQAMDSYMVFLMAQGNVGWELKIVSDTSDFNNKYFEYRDLIDSIRVDPTYIQLGVKDRAARKHLGQIMTLQAMPWGVAIRPEDPLVSNVRVVDVQGRAVGRMERDGAVWNWTSNQPLGPCWVVVRSPHGVATRALPVMH